MLVIHRTTVFLLTMGMVFCVGAGDMYKWKDKDGILHFSSTPPASSEDFDTFERPSDPKPMVIMRKLGTEREPEYSFFNNTWGPVELTLKMTVAENIVTDPPLPASLTLPARTERRLLRVKPNNLSEGYSYRLSYQSMIGAPLAELPKEVDYYPPFPLGNSFIISQGFDNDQTHNKPPNQYAVDIVMPVGTPILAARAGKVIEMEDDFHGAGQSDRFLSRSNQVRILHSDGSMAVYAHLQANSLRVRPGAMVATGQWIASSGNTGFSSGPHLHFVVQINVGMSLESMPFRFFASGGKTSIPGERKMLAGVLQKK